MRHSSWIAPRHARLCWWGLLVAVVLAGANANDVRAADRAASQVPPQSWTPQVGQPLQQPRELRSGDGVLRVELDARRSTIDVAGAPIEAQAFNGELIGPTLRVRPGDRLEVTFRNGTSHQTNIHYHGLHVKPTVARTTSSASSSRRARRSPSCNCRAITRPGPSGTTCTCTG